MLYNDATRIFIDFIVIERGIIHLNNLGDLGEGNLASFFEQLAYLSICTEERYIEETQR